MSKQMWGRHAQYIQLLPLSLQQLKEHTTCTDRRLSFSYQNLLQTRLVYEPFVGGGRSEQLLDEVKVMCAGCDFVTMELLRLRGLAPVSPLHSS